MRKIADIHPEDAYYPYRKQLIGKEITDRSRIEDCKVLGRPWQSAKIVLKQPILWHSDLKYTFYFLAILVENS